MSQMTPSERSILGQIAAHTSWAKTIDRPARTANARAAVEAKFLEEADGDPVRAAHLRKAYFQRLALRSAQARRRSAQHMAEAEKAEQELTKLRSDWSLDSP